MISLGLDISTSITGFCLVDAAAPIEERLLLAGGIITNNTKDMYSKALLVRDVFHDLRDRVTIDRIVVEENLQAFRRGMSSAKTLSTLARFNGIVSFLAQDVFSVPVERMNVNSARSQLGVKIDRKSDVPIKEQILHWIQATPEFESFAWPMKTLKSGPRKGQTIHAPECFDIADAAVVCFAGLEFEQ